MLKYILATLFLVAVWFLWFLVDPPSYLWVPLTLTVMTGLVLIGLWVLRRIRARSAAQRLETAMAEQAAAHSRGAGVAAQAELAEVQQEFTRAVAALKESRVGGSGQNALYALPWELVIGPPGSGKTTALRNSGLQFPYASGGGSVRGIGGTRNCAFWLTNDAVILDTAGRWTTEEDDREEWLGFLDMLRAHRPGKPLNGLIATVALDDLGGKHEEEAAALARRIRERIDEVQNRLQVSLPVYVLFTKGDLIPGFVETFEDLPRQERGQIWGFTVPLGEQPPDPMTAFMGQFDELTRALERRVLKRMGDERNLDKRALIYAFPQQVAALRRNTASFVGQLFEPTVLGQAPIFRGAYLASGTQEGRPIDRVMHKMAEAFGLRGEAHLGEPVTEAKSYFLRDLFLDVVFRDADVAAKSEGAQAIERRNRFAAAGVIFAIALMMLALPAIAWANNRSLLSGTRDIVDAVPLTGAARDPLVAREVEDLRVRTELLRRYDGGNEPVWLGFGMYASRVYPALKRFYADRVARGVVEPIAAEDTARLRELASQFLSQGMEQAVPPDDVHGELYDRLKLHLLLSYPRAEGEPNAAADPELLAWIQERIVERWVELRGGPEAVSDEERAQMEENASFFATILAEDPGPTEGRDETLRLPRDDRMVDEVRSVLSRVSITDMALSRMTEGMTSYDLDLERLVGTVSAMRAAEAVRGAYTRRAWDDRVRALLYGTESGAFGEAWVLGTDPDATDEPTEAERQEQLRELRNAYFRAYINEWVTFLRSVVVSGPRENVPTLAALRDLTRGEPRPHRLLFEQVLYNTTLPMPERSDGGGLAEAATDSAIAKIRRWLQRNVLGRLANRVLRRGEDGEPTDALEDERLTPDYVRLAFDGFTRVGAVPIVDTPEGESPPPPPDLAVSAYEEQLETVRDALQTHLDTPTGTADALETALQTARTATLALVEAQEVGWRPRLLAMLWPPIEGATTSHMNGVAESAGQSWCSEVYQPYARNIAGGYPLEVGGHDVPLSDFTAFYAPGEGTLWTYYADRLERRVRRDGDHFVFAQNLGPRAANVFRSSLLDYLDRAQDITSVFFPPNADGPTVQLDVRLRPSPRVATQTFCLGGECTEYHNGPEEWVRTTWPGETPEAGASLEIRGEDGIHERLQQDGEWGLFRLLEAGTVTSTARGRRVFTVTWRLRDHDVDIRADLRPVRGDAPFFGVRGRASNPPLLQPLRASQVDPPAEIYARRALCRVR